LNFKTSENVDSWELQFEQLLPLWGHRNWIVIADAAYPAQSSPSIETLATGANHLHVLQKVLEAIARSGHVRANTYIDAELEFVPEQDAPGVTEYRQEVRRLANAQGIQTIAHEQLITRLDASSRLYRVLVLKTALTIPYTSVFLELDCGYWSREAEERLRDTLSTQ
jgi:D-ribose pyranose/furanose isomerase RbsD